MATPGVGPVEFSDAGSALENGKIHPAAYPDDQDVQSLPDAPIAPFVAGSKNALQLIVDDTLAQAYKAYFSGEGQLALDLLAETGSTTPLAKYHVAEQRIRTLIMMGSAAEAETAADMLAEHEKAAIGTNVNALAYRSEARLWLEDYEGAEQDALQVAQALSGWVLPASYGGPPTNMAEIVLLTTAQLRAYTVLAGVNVMQGEVTEALRWAEAAERGFNAVHAVADHPVYGIFLKPYPESYYGRAFNLLFRGVASAVAGKSYAAGSNDFDAAEAFFVTIGYRAGVVASAALRSWTLYQLDQDREQALAVSANAIDLATKYGFPDYIWRISTLRGEMLIDEGRMAEAEAMLRQADAAVDLVTGNLATDRAKLRYGVGKETIVYRLAQFDVAAGDYAQLFNDLERGRARAFVDMLAGHAVGPGRHAGLSAQITKLDEAIKAQWIKQLAPIPTTAPNQKTAASLMTQRRELVTDLREADPDLADVYAIATARMERVQQRLGPEDAMVYVLPTQEADPVRLLHITPWGAQIVDTDFTGKSLHRFVIRFQESVTLNRRELQERLAEELEQRLAFAQWAPPGRLYVVPAGDFFFMPWGVLPSVGKTAVLPTGGWVLRTTPAIRGENIALIGDPEFGGELPQLDGARAEVEFLADLYGSAPLLGEDATRQAMRSKIGSGAALLHVATHGVFDANEPLNSSVMLSDAGRADPVTAADLYSMLLPVDLVVLSACDTGMGKVTAGNDFLGLVRSFYLGGARVVVNSLWPVSDIGTQKFMQVFYSEISAGHPVDEAWLRARNKLRDDGFPPSVYGAYIVGGSS